MASLTIRDLPDQTKETLRVQAAKSGLSLEAYVRHVLQMASSSEDFQPVNIAKLATRHFGPRGGVELELPSRKSRREAVTFQP